MSETWADWQDPASDRVVRVRTQVVRLRDGRTGTINPDDLEQMAAVMAAARDTERPAVARWLP